MISHKYKCIFIHIPKCAGTSITKFLADGKDLSWIDADYEYLHGWCPKRKFFMQHATAKKLLETELISEDIWKSYYTFTFIRNPYDRAISDYFWLQKDQNINGTFKEYLLKKGVFEKYLKDEGELYYRGDHQQHQTSFFDMSGALSLDFIGRFESFQKDMKMLMQNLKIANPFNQFENKSVLEKKHYSFYYTRSNKRLVSQLFARDLSLLGYQFENKRNALDRVINFFL